MADRCLEAAAGAPKRANPSAEDHSTIGVKAAFPELGFKRHQRVWFFEHLVNYIYTLTRHSRPPGTPPVLSSPFPLSFLACPFTSFHFTAASAPFISLKTPSFAFLSLFDLSFSCSLVSPQRPLHSRAMPLTCISFTFQSLLFPFSPLFRIASMHSIISIIRDDAGNAGGVVQY